MDKKLKQELKDIITGHRPRPLMYVGMHNGKKCYVRKQDLTYWQLREKHPPPFKFGDMAGIKHILAPQHHLTPRRLRHKISRHVAWGCVIAFLIFTVIVYLWAFIVALL